VRPRREQASGCTTTSQWLAVPLRPIGPTPMVARAIAAQERAQRPAELSLRIRFATARRSAPGVDCTSRLEYRRWVLAIPLRVDSATGRPASSSQLRRRARPGNARCCRVRRRRRQSSETPDGRVGSAVARSFIDAASGLRAIFSCALALPCEHGRQFPP